MNLDQRFLDSRLATRGNPKGAAAQEAVAHRTDEGRSPEGKYTCLLSLGP